MNLMNLMNKKHHKAAAEPPADAPAADTTAPADADAPLTLDEQKKLRDQAAHAEEWKSKYLYGMAELDNYRKRAIKERSELLKYAGRDVLYELLDVADNLARALEADRQETDPRVIVDGLDLIHKQLMKLLDKFGVCPLQTDGVAFDPNRHEALQQVPTADAAPGTVIAELQPGYTFRDKILRPARVVVAAALPDPPAA